jgi:integrase
MTDEDSLLRSYICGNSQTDEPVYYLPPENLNELCRRLRTEQEIAVRLIVQSNLRPGEAFDLRWTDLEMEENRYITEVGEPPINREVIIDSNRLIKLLKDKEQEKQRVIDLPFEVFKQDLDSACKEKLKPFHLRRGKFLKLEKQEDSQDKLDKFFGLVGEIRDQVNRQ